MSGFVRAGDVAAILDYAENEFCECDYAVKNIREEVEKLPAADVVEVVRCKNCRFCVKDGTFEGMWCRGERVSPEYYCAGGKREEKKDKQDDDCARIIADILTSQYELWKSAINELCVREANDERVKNEMVVVDDEHE